MQFNNLYSKLLTELFNTKQEAEWVDNGEGYDTILIGPNDAMYVLSMIPFWDVNLPPEVFNMKELTPEDWNTLENGSWIIEFVSEAEERSIEITGDQGMNATKVFSLVGNALMDRISSYPQEFRNIIFEAKEDSRRSLYSKLAPILARKLNKKLVISPNKEWYFLLAK
jgi:hypothetical protein